MNEYLIALGSAATMLFTIITFLKVKAATSFRDFSIFTASLIIAIALTFFVTSEESVLLAVATFLYVNAIWFYGVGNIKQQERKTFFAPGASRIFIGLVFFIIASWIIFSRIDPRLALIILLVSILLATYRIKMAEKYNFKCSGT